MKSPFKLSVLLIVLGALLGRTAQAQQGRDVIEIGDLWENTTPGGENASGYDDGVYMRWPGGYPDRGGSDGGTRTNSTGPVLRFLLKGYEDFFGEYYPFYQPSSPRGCNPPPGYQRTKFVREARTPTVVVDAGGNEQLSNVENVAESQYIRERPNLISDVMIRDYQFYRNGLMTRSNYYAWANPYHNDYIIREVTVFNTGNIDCDPRREEDDAVTLDSLYLSYFVTVLHPNLKGDAYSGFDGLGKLDGYMDYYGGEANDSLRVLFGFDGDDPNTPTEDRGDPFPERYVDDTVENPEDLYSAGELVSAMYPGYGVLHADTSPTDDSDDLNQPYTTGATDWPTAVGWNKGQLFLNMFNEGRPGHLSEPDLSQPPTRNYVAGWMSMGPYRMEPQDSLKFVFVHAVGGPPAEAAAEVGQQWANGEISDEEKNDFVAQSRDTLMTVVNRAAWNWRERLSNGRSIPMAPKPPRNLRVEARQRRVELSWDESASPSTDTYRIYRKAGTYYGSMELVGEVPASQTTYTDESIDLAVSYYYSVTAATDGGGSDDPTVQGNPPLESSRFFNRSEDPARPFRGSRGALDSVRVVPNPYNLSQTRAFKGEPDRITFTNLTTNSTIRIFNVAGDHIKTLRHRDESAYEHWSPMLTDDNLFPSSGLYVYHITDEDSGETTTGKFVIIR